MEPRTDLATLELVAADIRGQAEDLRTSINRAQQDAGGPAHERALLLYRYQRLKGAMHVYGVLAGAPRDDSTVIEAEVAGDLLDIDLDALRADIDAATR